MRLDRDLPSRCSRLILIVLLSLSWSGWTAQSPLRAAPSPEGAAPAQDQRKLAALLERLSAAARERADEPGACPWDWRAQAMRMADADLIFRFVRDEIAFEPYSGILRGNEGVLMSRSGNAIEQSVLLHDMLASAGYSVRLMQGSLPAEQAERLLVGFIGRDPLEGAALDVAAPDPGQEQKDQRLIEELGLPQEFMDQYHRAQQAKAGVLRGELQSTRAREEAFVRQALAGGDVVLGEGAVGLADELRAGLKAHYWVQMQETGADEWIDLDPCFADAARGTVYAQSPDVLLTPGEELIHRLTLRLLLKRQSGAEVQQEVLLETQADVKDLATTPMRFAIMPAEGQLPSLEEIAKLAPDEVGRLVAGIQEFQACLFLGNMPHASPLFDRKGQTRQPQGSHPADAAGEIGGAMGGLFGELEGEDEPKEESKLVRLWVELEFAGPGGIRSQERVLLDEHPRRNSTLLTDWHVFVQAQPLPWAYTRYLDAQASMDMASALAGLLRGDLKVTDSQTSGLFPAALSPAMFFAVQRQAELAELLAAAPQASRPVLLWSEPNVFISKRNLRLGADGSIGLCSELDLVHNTVRLLERGPALKPDPDAMLRLGVLDTCLEELLSEACPISERRKGTVSYFAQRRIEGRAETRIARNTERDLGAARMPAYTRQWLAASAPPTAVAIYPAQWAEQEPFYYWSIDADTGQCVGRSWDGCGQAATERKIVNKITATFFLAGQTACVLNMFGNNADAGSYICCSAINVVAAFIPFGGVRGNLIGNFAILLWGAAGANWSRLDPC